MEKDYKGLLLRSKTMKRKYDKFDNRSYWYKQYIGECPVCGRDQSFKERVYGRKPKDLSKVYIELSDFQTFDHCI